MSVLRWHRSAELIHSVLPRAMRTLFRGAFHERYGHAWVDAPEYGRFFVQGGVAPWTDFTQLLVATGDWDRIEGRPTNVIKVSEDLSTLLQKGDTIRLGACGQGQNTCVSAVLARDPTPPNPHRGYATLKTECDVPPVLDGQEGALHIYGGGGGLPMFSPLALVYVGEYGTLTLDEHVCRKIKSGLLDECDVTALSTMLVRVRPPSPVVDAAAPSTGSEPLAKSFLKGAGVKDQARVDGAMKRCELLPGDAVKLLAMVRNEFGAHVANTHLDEASLNVVRGRLGLFATVCFSGSAAATARAEIEADIKRALCSYPGGVAPLNQYLLDSKKARIDRGQTLGAGNFADVYPGHYAFRSTGDPTPVAFKVIRQSSTVADACTNKSLERELSIGRKIRHPNLVSVFGLVQLEDHVAIVMELMSNRSLHDLVHKADVYPVVPWPDRCRFGFDVVCGMEYLHSFMPNPIIHRDLKSANIILWKNQAGAWAAKVADYGLAKELTTTIGSVHGAGTLVWSAPESFFKQSDERSDVFSFSIVLYELASRSLPHTGKSLQEIDRIAKARFEFNESLLVDYGADEATQHSNWLRHNPVGVRRPDIALVEDDCPKLLLDVMRQCWRDDPGQRPSFGALLGTFPDVVASAVGEDADRKAVQQAEHMRLHRAEEQMQQEEQRRQQAHRDDAERMWQAEQLVHEQRRARQQRLHREDDTRRARDARRERLRMEEAERGRLAEQHWRAGYANNDQAAQRKETLAESARRAEEAAWQHGREGAEQHGEGHPDQALQHDSDVTLGDGLPDAMALLLDLNTEVSDGAAGGIERLMVEVTAQRSALFDGTLHTPGKQPRGRALAESSAERQASPLRGGATQARGRGRGGTRQHPGAVYRVAGAGMEVCDGWFAKQGAKDSTNGMDQFHKINKNGDVFKDEHGKTVEIRYCSIYGEWYIGVSGSSKYEVKSAASSPPLSGWKPNLTSKAPAPTLIRQRPT